MKAVIQRVSSARLSVNGSVISEISTGLVVFLGIAAGDTQQQADILTKKIAQMRIFSDENGKMNLSSVQLQTEILLVSQFTLLADCSRGHRPGFEQAERPDRARPLYEYTAEQLRQYGLMVKTGVFGADMKIEQMNDGPVTILLTV